MNMQIILNTLRMASDALRPHAKWDETCIGDPIPDNAEAETVIALNQAIDQAKLAKQAQPVDDDDVEYYGLEPWQRPKSPTDGMNLAQRILHVGGRNNSAGYVEFGSIQAVRALVLQVLRDTAPPPRQPLTDEEIDSAIAELGLNYFADAANNRAVLRELCKRAAHGITKEKNT